ncbi:MAG: hypothetical protein LAP85_16805 [Acidobacteriia bacterium]|nr:hypothetical protein [Terriglobia bacterium]
MKFWHSSLVVMFAISALIHGQDKFGETVPFSLAWVEGKCVDCQTALMLGRIQFVSRNEAWAVGVAYPPPGAQGAGDFIVVHTKDAGHTWRELRQTREHAGDEDGPPAFSFLDSERGWIAWWDPAREPKMIRTRDGGRHWLDVSDKIAQKIVFFDDSRGYGTEVTTFLRTNDGGRHWTETQIPDVRFIDRMFFLTPEIGWLAGTDGKDFFVFRTTNGGENWEKSRTTPPKELASVRDIFFLNPNRGWLVTWQLNDGGTYLYSTENGGKTWVANTDLAFQGKGNWISVVRFVSDRLGFLFESNFQSNGNQMLFTRDGGTTWIKQTLPHSVYDCQVFDGDLLCAGGGGPKNFRVLTVHSK